MKKILCLTTSPTVGGNGDALMEAAAQTAQECGAEIQRIDVRKLHINPCRGCYGCAKTGVCVQKDDMASVLVALHECDGLIAEAPVYYNCMAAQALLVIDRLCCTFACKSHQVGPKKKIGVFLTCTGSDVEEMKHHVQLIVDLPSIRRSVEAERTEVFTGCGSRDTCKKSKAYLDRASETARWVSEPGTAFDYSTGNTHLLCAVLQAATGMTLYDFGKEYLFDPMDMGSVSIEEDPQGVADGGNGIWMTTADMAKIGLLYLDHGLWRGEQLVPESWVEQSTTTQFVPGGGRANYGFQWWVRTFGDAAYPAYFAQGHAGQYIMVVPQLALVIAFNSDYEGATRIYWQLANEIVNVCVSDAEDAQYFENLTKGENSRE